MADVPTSSIASLFNYIEKVKLTNEMSQATTACEIEKYKELIGDRFINTSSDDCSIIHNILCNSGKIEVQRVKEMINVVLQSGIDINYYNKLGQTPLDYFLQESFGEKYPVEYREEITKFLLERGAKYNSKKIAGNDSLGFIEEGISNSLKEDIKREFNKYITNEEKDHIIEKVSIDGICANITLNTNTKLRVSEFLQSKLCQDKGIYAFNTSFNGEEEIHGFISFDGLRHYTVTKGVYEMKLNWYCEGKEQTIDIKISSQGIELINRNGVTDEQISANKDVIVNGLSLLDGIKRGVQKGIGPQQSFNNNETIKSTENYKELFNTAQSFNSTKYDIASLKSSSNESIPLSQKEKPLIGLSPNSVKFERELLESSIIKIDKRSQASSMNSVVNNSEIKGLDRKRNNPVDREKEPSHKEFITELERTFKEKSNGLKTVENKPKDYSTSSQDLFESEEISENKSLIQLSAGGKRPQQFQSTVQKQSVDSGISSESEDYIDETKSETHEHAFLKQAIDSEKKSERYNKVQPNKSSTPLKGHSGKIENFFIRDSKLLSPIKKIYQEETKNHLEIKGLDRKRNNPVYRGEEPSHKEFITELEKTFKEKSNGLKTVENKPKDYSTSLQDLFESEEISENKSLIQLSTGGKRPQQFQSTVQKQFYNHSVDSGISSDDREEEPSHKEFITELERTFKEKSNGLKTVENKPKDYSTSSQDLFESEEISENKSLIQLSAGGRRPNYDTINSQLSNVTVQNHSSHGLSK